MYMDRYQEEARKTAQYPGRGKIEGLIYTTLGLAGESGELANKVKKVLRDNGGIITDEVRLAIIKELEDNLWYVAMTADELGVTMSELAQWNLMNLMGRRDRGTIKGSGDDR